MKKLSLLIIVLSCLQVAAKDEAARPVKYRKSMPVQFEIAAGSNNSHFIDFATSPLNYKGSLESILVTLRKPAERREVYYSIGYAFGAYKLSYHGIEAKTKVLGLASIRHSRLYRAWSSENKRWDVKAGGTLDFTGLMRVNPALMNNQLGTDFFINIMASGKATWDISNQEKKKFLFFRLKPKHRTFAYQLDAGIINGAWRNKFIYSYSSAVYNDPGIFKDHSFKFSGFRMGSRLDYEFDIFNKNTLKLSYLWDALMTGKKDTERFQLANHSVLLSLNVKIR